MEGGTRAEGKSEDQSPSSKCYQVISKVFPQISTDLTLKIALERNPYAGEQLAGGEVSELATRQGGTGQQESTQHSTHPRADPGVDGGVTARALQASSSHRKLPPQERKLWFTGYSVLGGGNTLHISNDNAHSGFSPASFLMSLD